MTDASVVICTHADGRWGDLESAVASVAAQAPPPREVIVVVDHNPGLLARALERWPDHVVVGNEQQHGLSGARNTGVARASAAVVAFLDDDAVAEPGWLAGLAADLEDVSVMAVGGRIDPVWPSSRPGWFPEEFDWVVGCSYRGQPTERRPVRNVIGASMAFRRDVLAEVGGFRSEIGRIGSLPVGCEETELCIRARRRWPDRTILYDPAVRVRHRVAPDRTRWRYFVSRCYAEGRSKAVVARLAGPGDALSTELSYTTRVLPAGVVRGLVDGVVRLDPSGLRRAGAIVAGLAVTTAGFLRARLGSARAVSVTG